MYVVLKGKKYKPYQINVIWILGFSIDNFIFIKYLFSTFKLKYNNKNISCYWFYI